MNESQHTHMTASKEVRRPHTATHFNTLQHTATHSYLQQHASIQRVTPHTHDRASTSLLCKVRRHTATRCNARQHAAPHRNKRACGREGCVYTHTRTHTHTHRFIPIHLPGRFLGTSANAIFYARFSCTRRILWHCKKFRYILS